MNFMGSCWALAPTPNSPHEPWRLPWFTGAARSAGSRSAKGTSTASAGRDHNGQGFSIWLAGGGIQGGMSYGATNEVGHKAIEGVVTPNDFQATVLNLLGLDHEWLVSHAIGREQRLTDGHAARVVREILASTPTA